jgi:uncharacterized small protein (DUF1192 family)
MTKTSSTSFYCPPEHLDDVKTFAEYQKSIGSTLSKAVVAFIVSEVRRVQGKEPNQVSALKVTELEAEYFRLNQEIETRERNILKKKEGHRIYNALVDFVDKGLGSQEGKPSADEILARLYSYKVTENDPFTQEDLELCIQILERTQKRSMVHAALLDVRKKAKGNLILSENPIEPSVATPVDSNGEDEALEESTDSEEANAITQPEEEHNEEAEET